MTSPRVAVICGGPSSEAEVSRTSARAVAKALSDGGFPTQTYELTSTLVSDLLGACEVVFPAVHGPLGEDGCLQGLLEVAGLPYVGSGVLASALAANKPRAKELFRAAGLPLARSTTVRGIDEPGKTPAELRRELGRALVVKPAGGGSAIGVTRIAEADGDEKIVDALRLALTDDAEALVESLRAGLEVTCGVLHLHGGEPRALPVTLIEPLAAEWYDFKSRYGTRGSRHHCPAPFDGELSERIQSAAVRAHQVLGARDLSRADFVVNQASGEITLLELNTLPGMTQTSLFPEAAAVSGVGFPELCRELVVGALGRAGRAAPQAVPMPA